MKTYEAEELRSPTCSSLWLLAESYVRLEPLVCLWFTGAFFDDTSQIKPDWWGMCETSQSFNLNIPWFYHRLLGISALRWMPQTISLMVSWHGRVPRIVAQGNPWCSWDQPPCNCCVTLVAL